MAWILFLTVERLKKRPKHRGDPRKPKVKEWTDDIIGSWSSGEQFVKELLDNKIYEDRKFGDHYNYGDSGDITFNQIRLGNLNLLHIDGPCLTG